MKYCVSFSRGKTVSTKFTFIGPLTTMNSQKVIIQCLLWCKQRPSSAKSASKKEFLTDSYMICLNTRFFMTLFFQSGLGENNKKKKKSGESSELYRELSDGRVAFTGPRLFIALETALLCCVLHCVLTVALSLRRTGTRFSYFSGAAQAEKKKRGS